MRCHICNEVLHKVEISKKDGKIKPCPTCLEEIKETVNEMDERFFDVFAGEKL